MLLGQTIAVTVGHVWSSKALLAWQVKARVDLVYLMVKMNQMFNFQQSLTKKNKKNPSLFVPAHPYSLVYGMSGTQSSSANYIHSLLVHFFTCYSLTEGYRYIAWKSRFLRPVIKWESLQPHWLALVCGAL